MTGFASGQISVGSGATQDAGSNGIAPRIQLELRSVNSRYLDLSLRLSEELRSLEPQIRERLSRSLKRGKVELRAVLQGGGQEGLAQPSVLLLQRLGALQDQILDWLPNATPLSVSDVLKLGAGESQPEVDWQQALASGIEQLLRDFLASRRNEGARLADMLRERASLLRTLVRQTQPLIPQIVQQQQQRFLDRWQEAINQTGQSVDPAAAQDRALAEASAFAIRIDVAEELSRLDGHLDELESLLEKGGELGKRLDFLIQELHREANTLGSKSAALEVTRIALDMKVLIEQMREQVQNIE